MVDVYLYSGHASPTNPVLRPVLPDATAALSVYLYAGHASPNDVVLRYSGELGVVTRTGTVAFTADDVSISAAGTVSAGAGTNTGTVAFTTDVVTLAASGNNISPPGAFPVTDDYRLRKNIQPVVKRAVVHRGNMAGRVAWWNRR